MKQPRTMWSGRLEPGTVKQIKLLAKKHNVSEAKVVDKSVSRWRKHAERIAATWNLNTE